MDTMKHPGKREKKKRRFTRVSVSSESLGNFDEDGRACLLLKGDRRRPAAEGHEDVPVERAGRNAVGRKADAGWGGGGSCLVGQ